MEKICVAVRVRPAVSSEPFNGTFWKVEDNRISLHKVHGTPISGLSYAFGMHPLLPHIYLYIYIYVIMCEICMLLWFVFRFFEIFL
jgi:hypothetical protein